MKKYTIYCTTEQTRKALELGAPIFTFSESFADGYRTSIYDKYCSIPPIKEEGYEDDVYADIPTTEQMLGWLETIAFQEINIQRFANFWEYSIYLTDDDMVSHNEHYKLRTEATISAIDAALEYLSKNKK